MIQRIRDARENESGFTLIELLIVIVVLGILAGIVVFGVSTFRSDADKSAACTNAKVVQVASEAFKAKSSAGTPAADVAALVTAGYLKSAPVPAVTYSGTTGDVTFPAAC